MGRVWGSMGRHPVFVWSIGAKPGRVFPTGRAAPRVSRLNRPAADGADEACAEPSQQWLVLGEFAAWAAPVGRGRCLSQHTFGLSLTSDPCRWWADSQPLAWLRR